MSQNEVLTSLLPADKRHLIKVSSSSCNFLLTLVDDILDMAKIENGQLEISKRKFNVRETAA